MTDAAGTWQAFAALGPELERRVGAQESERHALDELDRRAEEASAQASVCDEGNDLLAAIYEQHRTGFEEQIGSIVTGGLTDVFEEPLTLRAELGRAGDVPTLRFFLRDQWDVETEIVDARSGGYINVIAFLLQARVLLAARPALSRLMVLDECFGNIHESLFPGVARLLASLVRDGGFQFIVITQNQRFADALADIGSVLHYSRREGVTTVEAAPNIGMERVESPPTKGKPRAIRDADRQATDT